MQSFSLFSVFVTVTIVSQFLCVSSIPSPNPSANADAKADANANPSPSPLPTLSSSLDLDLDLDFEKQIQQLDQYQEDPELQEIMNWEIPYHIRKNYPYFLSGYDDEGSPVWFCEYGRWDVRAIMENGTESIKDFGRYVIQALTTIHLSPKYASTPENPVEEFVIVGDIEGYNYRQFSHVPTLTRALDIFRDYLAIEKKYGRTIKGAYGVNVNYFADAVYRIARPLIGSLAEKIHIYGTNGKWKTALLKEIPRRALPTFLGGYANHTALKIYG